MDSPANFVIAFSHGTKPGNYCQMHSHGGVEVVFHPVGNGLTACSDGSEIEFGPGETIIYPPGLQHDQRMLSEGVDNCIQIGIRELPAFPGLGKPLHLRIVRSQAAISELSDLSVWADDSPKAAKDLRAAALLLTLLNEGARLDLGTPEPGLSIASEARYIAISETKMPPSASEIAQRLELSPDHLRPLMLKHFGKGLKELSLEARVTRAISLLANSPMTLKEIASETGFANERALCCAFKLRTGSSPGHFRRSSLYVPENGER